MTQRLTPSVGAGDVVVLLVIVMSVLPNGAAGGRLALAGLLSVGWLALSGGRSQHDRGGLPGQLLDGRFVAIAPATLGPGTRAETGARRVGRDRQ